MATEPADEGGIMSTARTGNEAGHTLCKRCNGTGNVPDPLVWRANQGPRSARRCPDCQGTGRG